MPENQPPERVRHIGILYLVVGAVNLLVGWAISATLMSFFGGGCTGLLTCGMCPIGAFCGFLPFLMIPLAMIEITAGLVVLLQPDSARPAVQYMHFPLMASFLVGDLLSTIAGVIAMVLAKDIEVVDWLNQQA